MYTLIIVSYLVILAALWFNYSKVKKEYKVSHNGSKWVVRRHNGRFVRLSHSIWDVLAVAL